VNETMGRAAGENRHAFERERAQQGAIGLSAIGLYPCAFSGMGNVSSLVVDSWCSIRCRVQASACCADWSASSFGGAPSPRRQRFMATPGTRAV
jgi:hypothetical protein